MGTPSAVFSVEMDILNGVNLTMKSYLKTYKSSSGLIVKEMTWKEYQELKKQNQMTKDILELAEAVKKMRDAQKEYFRTRTPIALNQSKKMEKEVDSMIDNIVVPARSSQSNLFQP